MSWLMHLDKNSLLGKEASVYTRVYTRITPSNESGISTPWIPGTWTI